MDYLLQFGFYWFWFGLASLLLLIEVLHGRFVFIAVSLAAMVVGILSSLFVYIGWVLQVIIFIILAAGFTWISRYYVRERMARIAQHQDILTNRRYVGQVMDLVSPIENGHATLNINGMVWTLRGDDCPSGGQVKVVDMGDGWLEVEAVS